MAGSMAGHKMAIVPYKQWEEMNRWKGEHRPRLPPHPNVVHNVSLQKDLSFDLADEELPEADKAQKYGETVHEFKLAHQNALQGTQVHSEPVKTKEKRLSFAIASSKVCLLPCVRKRKN